MMNHITCLPCNRFSHFAKLFLFFLFLFSKNETMSCESLSKSYFNALSMSSVILFR